MQPRGIYIVIGSIGVAFLAALVCVAVMMGLGEGSFGAAKLAPLILVVLSLLFFCLVWFPATLIAWYFLTPAAVRNQQTGNPMITLSGVVFGTALALIVYNRFMAQKYRIDLRCRLEDQSGAPVSDAIVRFGWRQQDAKTVKSDSSGSFTVPFYWGEMHSIMPAKEGYVVASTNTQFEYRQLTNRVNSWTNVIRMWKLQGAEPLAQIDAQIKLRYFDKPIVIDFLTGKVVAAGGDLKFKVTRSDGDLSRATPGLWSVEVSAIDGGILESDSENARVTFEAPSKGYKDVDVIEMRPDDRRWSELVDRTFFVKSRNGQIYSRIYFSLSVNSRPAEPMWLTVRGVANTNGSRNWEATAR